MVETFRPASGISDHAKIAVADLLADEKLGEERFRSPVVDYDADRVLADLQQGQAYPRVDATVVLRLWSSQTEPRQTYFGFVALSDFVKLHATNGKALYAKNIRNFLGQNTDVFRAIQTTLATKPQDFVYLNNVITALCERIAPKDNKKAGKRLKLTGISVINGAQTIASSAQFSSQNPGKDFSTAEVLVTFIKADGDGAFGKAVICSSRTFPIYEG